MSKYTLVLDSSQISTFLECQQLWYYKYVKHLVPNYLLPQQEQSSEPMNAGTYGHKLLDIYYRARVRGFSLNDAAAVAFSYNPDVDTCVCGCTLDCHQVIEKLKVTECTKCRKCLKPHLLDSTKFDPVSGEELEKTLKPAWEPKPFELSSSTRMAVQTRLTEYFYKYQHNDFVPLSEQSIEVGFSEAIYEDSENLFVLEGRIDLLATLQGLQLIVDHKFQMREHELYAKSVQFRNYALIGRANLFMVNYIHLHKAVKDSTLVRELVNFTPFEHAAWKRKLIDIYFRIKRAKELGDDGGQVEQNFGACPGRFNYACNFTQLCEEPQADVALLKEKQLYQINETPWKPW